MSKTPILYFPRCNALIPQHIGICDSDSDAYE